MGALQILCGSGYLCRLMQVVFNHKEQKIIDNVAAAAQGLGLPCYLIGGFVRDKLLDRPTKDADFVCAGDALQLATVAAQQYMPPPKVNYFKNFGTAQFRLQDGFDLEFVGARKESYQRHSRKPEVEAGTIEEDQPRRDFTINAWAIS